MSSNPPAKSGLSLYANLLDPQSNSNSSTISSAPVVYNKPGDAISAQREKDAKKINAAALRFQPVKRPQIQQKGKPKPAFTKPAPAPTQSFPPAAGDSSSTTEKEAVTVPATQPAKTSTLADWQAIHDENDYDHLLQKPERGGARKKKKLKQQDAKKWDENWDGIYNPAMPTNFEAYRGSEEQNREIDEWKTLLYRHRLNTRMSSDEITSDDETGYRPDARFAPPPNLNDEPADLPDVPAIIPDDTNGEDAFQRRMRMSQPQFAAALPPIEPTDMNPPPQPQPPPLEEKPQIGVISAAPVRYNNPPREEPEDETAFGGMGGQMPPEEPDDRLERPRKQDIGRKLLEKMGWQKGQGLGAQGTGIINPLSVKLEKRKRLPDHQGGGFSGPAGMGKIVGGKKSNKQQEESKFGSESVVIVLRGMLDGLDIEEELGELTQEIGEKCNRFGNVERVFIHRYSDEPSKPVFIKFVEQVSALNAVNNLNGQNFHGNTITARYFDAEKFGKGEYA